MTQSNDIKGLHDANPTAGDDTDADYYLATVKRDSTGQLSDVGLSMPQARAILQVDPATPTDVFSLTMPANTLDAIVGTITGSYTHWQISTSATPPTYAAAGWNAWPLPQTWNIADDPSNPVLTDWTDAKTFYLYVKDTVEVHSIAGAGGVFGVTVSANDDRVDVGVSDLTLSAGTNAATQIIYEFDTGADNATGIDQYDLCVAGTNDVFVANVTRSAQVTVTGLPSLDPATETQITLSLWVRITDNVGNESLESASNTVSITMGAPPSLGTFSVADTTAGTPATVTISGEDAAIDEFLLRVGNINDPPDENDSGWGSKPSTVQLPGPTTTLGSYDVVLHGRDATYPSGISAKLTDLAVLVTDASGTAQVSFSAPSSECWEYPAPTHNVTITKSNNAASAVTFDVTLSSVTDPSQGATSAIISDDDYAHIKPFTVSASMGSGVTSYDVDLDVLFNNLGTSGDVEAQLDISNVSGGAAGTITSHVVRVKGNNGIWPVEPNGTAGPANPDIDWNDPDRSRLQTIASLDLGDSQTVTHRLIDSSSSSAQYAVDATDSDNSTLENCEVTGGRRQGIFLLRTTNLEVRNCYIHDNDRAVHVDSYGYNIFCDGAGGSVTQGLELLNNLIKYGTGGVRFNVAKLMNNFAFEYNLLQDFTRKTNEGQSFFFTNCSWGATPPVIRGNISTFARTNTAGEDHINTFKTGGNLGGTPAKISLNQFLGQSDENGSGATILLGDNARGLSEGNSTAFDNECLESGVTALALMGGQDCGCWHNDVYMGPNSPFVVKNQLPGNSAVGCVIQRAIQTDRGDFQDATLGENRLGWFTDYNTGAGPQSNNIWRPTVGAGSVNPAFPERGVPPNHGTYSPAVEEGVIGYDQVSPFVRGGNNTNLNMNSGGNGVTLFGENWETAGEEWVYERKYPLTQPGAGSGIYIRYFSYLCPVGDGLLTYDPSGSGSLQFRAYGDSPGAAVSLGSPWYGGTIKTNTTWQVNSATSGMYVVVKVDATVFGSLPVTSKTWTVKATRFTRRNPIHFYVGSTGRWVGDSGVTPPTDTTPPTPPTNVSASAGSGDPSTELDITWTAGTDAVGVTANRIFVDGVLNQTVGAVTSATVTGLTESNSYEITIKAGDAAGNWSDLSEPDTGTTSADTGNEELLNAEFTANSTEPDETTGWDASAATPSPITPTNGTEFEVVRASGGSNASLYQKVTGLTGSSYSLTVGHKLGTGNTNGKVVVSNNGTARPWTGTVQAVLTSSNSSTYTEYQYTGIVPGSNRLDIALWTNSGTAGNSTFWDYCRLREE